MTSAYLNRSPLPLPPLRLQRMTSFFFFNDTATTEIYTLSLHDALPIYDVAAAQHRHLERTAVRRGCVEDALLPRPAAVVQQAVGPLAAADRLLAPRTLRDGRTAPHDELVDELCGRRARTGHQCRAHSVGVDRRGRQPVDPVLVEVT